jgi:hypothetical protein
VGLGAEAQCKSSAHLDELHVEPVIAGPLGARRERQLSLVSGDDGRQVVAALQEQALRLGDLRRAFMLAQAD